MSNKASKNHLFSSKGLCLQMLGLVCSNASIQGGEAGYRAAIHKTLPGIKVLDDVPLHHSKEVGTGDEETASRSSMFVLNEAGMGKDWQILQESIKQGRQVEHGEEGVDGEGQGVGEWGGIRGREVGRDKGEGSGEG